MRNTPGPSSGRRQPPVALYALVIGLLVAIGIFATLYGQSHQNPIPSPVSSARN